MTISIETLVAFLGVAAGVVTAVVVLFRWVEDQDRARHVQLRREISNEIRAEFYRHLLELNVVWLSTTPQQRETLNRLVGEADSQSLENQERADDDDSRPRPQAPGSSSDLIARQNE